MLLSIFTTPRIILAVVVALFAVRCGITVNRAFLSLETAGKGLLGSLLLSFVFQSLLNHGAGYMGWQAPVQQSILPESFSHGTDLSPTPMNVGVTSQSFSSVLFAFASSSVILFARRLVRV